MSDEITDCQIFRKTGDNSLIKYRFFYTVENAEDMKCLFVDVEASEMTDPEDITEAKSLANSKALTAKNDWIAEEFDKPVMTQDSSQNGPVTL